MDTTPSTNQHIRIGHGGQNALAFQLLAGRGDACRVVLIAWARPGLRGMAEIDTQRGLSGWHAYIFAAVRCAAPQVVRQRFLTPVRPVSASTASAAKIRKPD